MTAYTARCTREGKWWVIDVPEIRRASQARRLDQVEAVVRDLVGLVTDEDPEQVRVTVVPLVPSSVAELIDRSRKARAEAEAYAAEALRLNRAAVSELAGQGWTVRDIGRVLGVSFQRAQQLLTAD